jgi:lambda family phage tail tape measure protein
MEVAALGLRVDGADGIERARDALGGFTKASEGAERSTEKLGRESQRAKGPIDGLGRAGESAASKMSLMGAAALKAGAFVAAALSVNALKNYADSWSDMQSQVGAATGDMANAAASMQRLTDIANSSYSPLEQTVESYARNVATLRDLGKSSAEAADFTESLNHMLVLTATRGERAASVQNALAKAMAVGKLQADGLEAILANGGEVAQALANELGTTVSGLRAMASQGKITGQVMADAVIKPLDRVRERAAEMPATVADAFVRMQNNITEFVGALDKASGASSAISDVILKMADAVRDAGKYLVPLAQSAIPLLSASFDALAIAMTAAAAVMSSRLIASFIIYSATAIPSAITATVAFVSSITGLQVAMAAAAAKTAAFTVASKALSSGLALVGGPIGAVVLAVGAAAYAWYEYGKSARDNADAGALGVANMRASVDKLVESYKTLNEEQQKTVLNIKIEDLASATKQAQRAIYDLGAAFEPALSKGAKAAAKFRAEFSSQIQGIYSDSSLPAQEMAAAITNVINAHVESGQASADNRVELEALVKKFADASGNASRLKVELEALKASQDAVKQAASSTDLSPRGIEKWDEYLKKLTDARDVIGMSARQLGVFEAAQAGANSVQQEMAGIVTAQTDAFKKLQTAIEGKDKKAAEAAKNNVRALDVERQKVELLAIKTNALIAATNAFARGEVSGDVASGILQNMLAGFAQAEAAIKVSKEAEAQITNIYANAVPRTTGGGGASKEDELKNVIKQLTLQQGALGMTAEQAARYEIEMAKGSETDRKRALTLYDQIQAWNETEKAMQAAIDSSRQYLAFQQEMDVFQQKLNLESAGVGMGDRQREMAQADLAIRQEYAQKRLDLEMAQQVKETALTQEQYQYRLDLFQQFEEQKLAGLQQSAEARAIAEADWTNGMSRAWDNFATKAQDIAAQTEQIFTGMLNSFSVGFGNAFEKMVFDSENLGDAMRNVAQDMARAVVNALAQMAAQWLAYQAVQLFVGKTTQASSAMAISANAYATALQAGLAAFASTAAIPVVGPAAAPAAMGAALAVATPLATAISMTAMAGMAHDGIDSVPQTGTWLLEKGERVTTAKTSARLDSVLERIDARQRAGRVFDGQPGSSSKSEPRVVVQLMGGEFQGAQVTEERGSTDEEMIIRVMSREFLRGGQSFDALQSVSNVRRVGA